jgi:hypothetical protein
VGQRRPPHRQSDRAWRTIRPTWWSARCRSMDCPPLIPAIPAGRCSRSDGSSRQVRLHAPREDVAGMAWVMSIRTCSVAAVRCRCAEDPSTQLPVADVPALSHRASLGGRDHRHRATRRRTCPCVAPGGSRGRTDRRCVGCARRNLVLVLNAAPASRPSAAWSGSLPSSDHSYCLDRPGRQGRGTAYRPTHARGSPIALTVVRR